MKIRILALIMTFSLILPSVNAAPGDKSKLGWMEQSSVTEVLKQFGHKGLTCIGGNKIEDEKGYSIMAECVKGSEQYLARLWVSIDWKEGRVDSVTKRN